MRQLPASDKPEELTDLGFMACPACAEEGRLIDEADQTCPSCTAKSWPQTESTSFVIWSRTMSLSNALSVNRLGWGPVATEILPATRPPLSPTERRLNHGHSSFRA